MPRKSAARITQRIIAKMISPERVSRRDFLTRATRGLKPAHDLA
jgi:hypothetical protein